MPRFLHEISTYPNGITLDNGWWEIRGCRLYNRVGGWHDYRPSETDEIRECTWEDIVRETVRDDTQTTGWIAPDGTFYGCAPMDHSDLAECVLHTTERDLEARGYVKIYENPIQLRRAYPEYGPYSYIRCDGHHPNEAQLRILHEKGLEQEDVW